MLKITPSIQNINFDDIDDNPYHYEYDKELINIERYKDAQSDEQKIKYQSHLRSLEGKFFENYLVEKLIQYSISNNHVKYILAKGLHKINKNTFYNTLTVNHKGQIIYRANHKEIGEFDALIFTKDNSIYFVEMTLNKDLSALKKRLRKKRAILETIFPQYNIRTLIITTNQSIGTQTIPDYSIIWKTEPFFITPSMLEKINLKQTIKPYKLTNHFKLISPSKVRIEKFNYYKTLLDIFNTILIDNKFDLEYINTPIFIRLHNLFTKVYIGQIEKKTLINYLKIDDIYNDNYPLVGIEKKHTGEFILSFFIFVSNKELHVISQENEKIKIAKKDPFGITISEVRFIKKSIGNTQNILDYQHLLHIKTMISQYNALVGNEC